MPEKMKILFLAAEPVDAMPLRLGQEFRDIEQKLRSSPKGRSFNLVAQWAVRPRDLMEVLMTHRPTVVHFSGHSEGGRLILENEDGRAQPIEGKHLAALLAGFGDTLRLVVLNACFTSPGFDELREVVDYTVGTTSALSDSAAVRFSGCFYQALAFGNSVQAAYELAKRQTTLELSADSEVFTLLIRDGVDASEAFIRQRTKASKTGKNSPPAASRAEGAEKGRKDNSPLHATPTAKVPGPGNPAPGVITSSTVGVGLHGANVRGSSDQIPFEIRESLERFRRDYPDARKVAFLMMRFGKTKAHEDIVSGIKAALDPLGVTVVRADDKQYHDDLFPNVLTYVYGCSFGIAVFERIETEQFNPNVALEVGYMFALKKDICLLKDRTLNTLHADLVGKLYRVFDPLDPIGTIPRELSRWLRDKGLEETPNPGLAADA
jgi:hypothetical protein